MKMGAMYPPGLEPPGSAGRERRKHAASVCLSFCPVCFSDHIHQPNGSSRENLRAFAIISATREPAPGVALRTFYSFFASNPLRWGNLALYCEDMTGILAMS